MKIFALHFRFFSRPFHNLPRDQNVSVSFTQERVACDKFRGIWQAPQRECVAGAVLPVRRSYGDCKSVHNSFYAAGFLGKR